MIPTEKAPKKASLSRGAIYRELNSPGEQPRMFCACCVSSIPPTSRRKKFKSMSGSSFYAFSPVHCFGCGSLLEACYDHSALEFIASDCARGVVPAELSAFYRRHIRELGNFMRTPSELHQSRWVLNYDARPMPIFYGEGPVYFGCEFEVEVSSEEMSREDCAQHIISMCEADTIYAKRDGSLDYGFEIVTMPMSWQYLRNFVEELEEAFYDAPVEVLSTCGLHVHVSRDAFLSSAHEARFGWFFSGMSVLTEDPNLTGRDDGPRESWASDQPMEDIIHEARYAMDELPRYSAVNFLNTATLEVRLFGGTTNANEAKLRAGLVSAAFHYSKDVRSIKKMDDFCCFRKWLDQHQTEYPELHNYIERRHARSAA